MVLSVLHALIPNHWLPILGISRSENWSLKQTLATTFVAGLSHALSTVIIGVVVAVLGITLASYVEEFTVVVAPSVLIALGVLYIYRHYRHQHFHMHQEPRASTKAGIVFTLMLAMFFSPCFEIEAYFLMAGLHGYHQLIFLALLYTTVTVSGMVGWVWVAYKGMSRVNWHALEHNAGIITGVTLLLTGIISFFIH